MNCSRKVGDGKVGEDVLVVVGREKEEEGGEGGRGCGKRGGKKSCRKGGGGFTSHPLPHYSLLFLPLFQHSTFPPYHFFTTLPSFHHSLISPYYLSTISHHSTIPPFHHPTIPAPVWQTQSPSTGTSFSSSPHPSRGSSR